MAVEVDGDVVEVGLSTRGVGRPFLVLPGVPPGITGALGGQTLVLGAPERTSADVTAQLFLGVLDALGEYDVCVVGGPADAAVVAEVLARNPSRVSAVALLDPPAVADAVPDAGPAARLRTSALPVLVLGLDAAGWADAIPRAEVVTEGASGADDDLAGAVADFAARHAVSDR